MKTSADNAEILANSAVQAVPAVAIKEKRCIACPRPIPPGETHVYLAAGRVHRECLKKVNRKVAA